MQSSWTPSRVNVRSNMCPDIGLSLFFFLVGVEDKFALARFFPFKVVSCDLWWAILISGWGKRKRLESPRFLQGSGCCGQVAKGAAWVPKWPTLFRSRKMLEVSHLKFSDRRFCGDKNSSSGKAPIPSLFFQSLTLKSGWPSGLRRYVQVVVYICRRGFKSHFWQKLFSSTE